VRIPDETNRIAIVGATGSGKTQAELWQLSIRDVDTRPWVIFNWKGDANIDGIPGAEFIDLDVIPIKPGVYIYHPHPNQNNEVESIMWEIWERGGIGVVIDEGYMVGRNNPAFRAILTQGRSKEIPVIVLSQRPNWMDRFVFSESDFYQVFRLNDKRDKKSVQEFFPGEIDKKLPPYHSYYYDVARDKVSVLKPVPSLEVIYATFARKLVRVRKTV
jgi:hypothetical protein